MIRCVRSSLFLLLALVVSSAPLRPETARNICPLSEVRPGQIATAKSVFRGTKIESFRLEILAVVPKFDGTRSVILGKVLDGPVVRRKSGVIGGMSGSPVYIGGRLAGAIAYAWPWSKEPIAGIQPIEDMLEALDGRPAQGREAQAASGRPSALVRVDGSVIGRVQVSAAPSVEPDPPGVMTLVPLGGLVQASGFNARGLARLREQLAPYGLRVAAGGAGAELNLRPPLLPGAALGARLVGGDLDLTALGTLTMVEGDRVLAFGHPLFQRGDVDLPMTGGYVYDIIPSLQISNKIMSPTQVVGRVYSDQRAAVAGAIGGQADMIPVTIEVEDESLGLASSFNVEVARLRRMTPGLVASSVVTAVDEARGRIARGMAHVTVEIEAEGRKIVREDVEYSPIDAAAAAAGPVVMPLMSFMENQFGSMRLDQVRVRVRTREQRKTAAIERVTLDQPHAEAGEEAIFRVTVRPYGEDPVEIPLTLSLPPDLPQGRVRVVISGGRDVGEVRNTIGAPRPAPINLDQLVDRYLSREVNSDLVLQAALPRGGATMLGEELPDLPRSAIDALAATRPTDLRPMPSVVKVVAPTEWVLRGRQAVTLPVKSPIRGPGPPKPPEGAEPPAEPEEAAAADDLRAAQLSVETGAWPPHGLAAPRPPGPNRGDNNEEEEPEALTRGPEAWTQSRAADYAEAELENIALAADGSLSLSLARADLAEIPAHVVWCLAPREGTVYLGTGSEGKIFRVEADGEVAEFFDAGEMNVHALAIGPAGEVYAGTSPGGKVFRISPEGEGELLFDSDGTYVWSLVVAPDASVLAGTGSPAKIFEVGADGAAATLAELPATNVLSLARAESGELYAGTSDIGVIYRVSPHGAATAIAQAPGSSVDSLVLDADGVLFASSSPGGQVIRIPPGGVQSLHFGTGQRTVFGLALLPDGTPVAATGPAGLVLRAGEDRNPELIFRPDSGAATAIAEAQGALYVATSGPAVLRRFGPELAESGTVESSPLDAERVTQWGRVTWAADIPDGTAVSAETRSGDSPDPGDHWSAWAPTAGGGIASPAARYLQYRLSLSTDNAEITPVVRQVSVSGRQQNRPPMLVVRSPEPGQRLAKKHELKWQARDPDKDTLCYDVEVSSDLGESWEDIAEDLRETKHEWDTEEQDDGSYLLRVTASDRLGSPDSPETADAGFVVWVDNTAPSLVLFRGSLAVDDERRASVAGMAFDELSPIQSIEYRVGDEEWESAPLSLVESTVAEVAIETAPLDAGEHKLEVRAFDAAGNLATDSVEVTVEADEEEEADEEAEEEGEDDDAEDEEAEGEEAEHPADDDDADDDDADDDGDDDDEDDDDDDEAKGEERTG
jgi:hypothetical protein